MFFFYNFWANLLHVAMSNFWIHENSFPFKFVSSRYISEHQPCGFLRLGFFSIAHYFVSFPNITFPNSWDSVSFPFYISLLHHRITKLRIHDTIFLDSFIILCYMLNIRPLDSRDMVSFKWYIDFVHFWISDLDSWNSVFFQACMIVFTLLNIKPLGSWDLISFCL